MAIKTKNHKDLGQSDEYFRYRRKADQAWDLAGLARQDGDVNEMQRYTEVARELEKIVRELKTL